LNFVEIINMAEKIADCFVVIVSRVDIDIDQDRLVDIARPGDIHVFDGGEPFHDIPERLGASCRFNGRPHLHADVFALAHLLLALLAYQIGRSLVLNWQCVWRWRFDRILRSPWVRCGGIVTGVGTT
jgi:hypothetical protein